MKRKIENSRVILTGASSGIGKALAIQLAAQGAKLIVNARREDKIQELITEIERNRQKSGTSGNAALEVYAVCGDITDENVRKAIVQTAVEKFGGIDFLINNAGVGATSLLEVTPEEITRRLMEVNYFSAVSLTQMSLPYLKESAKSRAEIKQTETDLKQKNSQANPIIVFLGSIVGLRGVPHYGAYGAAKFAVNGYSESLRSELNSAGIDVLLVSPGTTQTEFFDVLLQSSSAPNMPIHKMVTSEYVAGEIISAMKKGKHRIIPYFQAKILNILNRFFPSLTDRIMCWYV
ncbi:MAG: SDR family NAD(P)-dependent oxidoreductase [Thermoguttaceae bacterium]